MADIKFMDADQIRTLTNHFCRMTKKAIKSPKELEGIAVCLKKHEDGWSLEAMQKPFNRSKFTTVIDLPEDLFSEDLDDAIIDLAGIISRKLTDSSRIINSNLRRSPEVRKAVSAKAVKESLLARQK